MNSSLCVSSLFLSKTQRHLPSSYLAFSRHARIIRTKNDADFVLVTISTGIIIVTLVTAFSNLLRATLWSIYSYVSTLIIVRSGLYSFWVSFREEWQSQKILHKTEKQVREMKREVQKAKRRRRREEQTRVKSEKQDVNGNVDGSLWNRLKRRWEPVSPTSTSSGVTNAGSTTTVGSAWGNNGDHHKGEGSDVEHGNGIHRTPTVPRFQLTPASPGTQHVAAMNMSGANTLHGGHDISPAEEDSRVDDDEGPNAFVITMDYNSRQ